MSTLAQRLQTEINRANAATSKTDTTIHDAIGSLIGGFGKENVTWHQCPELVRNYLESVTYDPSDYSTSRIAEFAPATAVQSNTKPIGKTVDGETYYNGVPNHEAPFSSANTAGTLMPLDHLRWLNTPSAHNVRDLGGLACDGGTVRYGLLFRGGEVSAEDRDVLVVECGVRHDLNLRGASEATWTESPLGSDIRFTKADDYNWYSATVNEAWKVNLRCVFEAVIHHEPVYFHCAAGADRTGTLACVLEGLLGVSQSDIDKDYELTCFYSGTATDAAARRRNESDWTGLIEQISAFDGSTFRDKCVTFAAMLGFTAEEINAFRAAMIDGTPETVTPSVGSFSITNTLSNVSTDNSAVTAVQYQPYTAKLMLEDGYVLSRVTVKMGGVDITRDVFSGDKTERCYAVTNNLTNCTASMQKTATMEGQAFVSFMTADEGYVLDDSAVTVMMGGIDVSDYYKNGRISIPNVTGDIVITATAVESAPVELPMVVELCKKCSYTVGQSMAVLSAASSYSCTTNNIPATAGKTYKLTCLSAPSTDVNVYMVFGGSDDIITEVASCTFGTADSYPYSLTFTPAVADTTQLRLRSYASLHNNKDKFVLTEV